MSDEFAFAPTDSQKVAMAAMKALTPGEHWSQVYNQLRSSYPDDFKDDYDVYVVANNYASVEAQATPPPAPTITALSPNTTPANADVTLAITGTGFSAGAAVMVGPTELSATGTATELSVMIPAADISIAGAVEITVKNSDGQLSNVTSLPLT